MTSPSKAFADAPAEPAVDGLEDAFLDAEAGGGLLDLEVAGVELWAVLRTRVHRLLMAQTSQRSGRPRPLRDRLLAQARTLSRLAPREVVDHLRLGASGSPRAELLVVAHPRLLDQDGELICRYTGPLMADVARSRVTLMGTDQGVRHPSRDPTVYWPELDLLRSAPRALGGRAARLLQRAPRVVEEAVAELERATGITLPRKKLLRHAALVMAIDLFYRPFCERLLERVRPRAVVEVVHYSDLNYVLNRVAAEAGLPVLELQHGTLGRSHIAYRARAEVGRRAPHFDGVAKTCWPTHFLSWGDLWVEQTPDFLVPRARSPAVGFELLEASRQRFPRRPSAAPTVLFISQWTVGDQLSRLAAETARALAGRGKVRYRLHPIEREGWRARYPHLEHAGIEVVDGAHPVYADQATAHVQAGVYSTAIVEGIAFGAPTLIADLDGAKEMRWLIEGGAATRVRSGADIAAAVLDEDRAAASPMRGQVWADHPRARFAAVLEAALTEGR